MMNIAIFPVFQATKNRMASIESLVSGLTAGVVFALFSGQPLTIMGTILIIEAPPPKLGPGGTETYSPSFDLFVDHYFLLWC